jgi:hypothetical protein
VGAGAGLRVLEINMALTVLPRFVPKIFLFGVLTMQLPRFEPPVLQLISYSMY